MKESLYELPFDQFQRYMVLKEIIELNKRFSQLDRLKILDVGGYPGLISEFLESDEVVITDLVPSEAENYVQADGTDLPFEDESFDVVASADVLEHVEPAKRGLFIDENLRVTKDLLILICPVKDQLTDLAEELLYQYVLSTQGKSFETLKEHLDSGLPDLRFVTDVFDKKKIPYTSFPSGYIYHWITMMLVKFYFHTLPYSEKLHKLTDKLYNLSFSPYDHQAPAYRKVFVASKKSGKTYLNRVRNLYSQVKGDNPEEVSQKLQLFALLFELFELESMREVKQQREKIEKLEKELQTRQVKIGKQKLVIRNQRDVIRERERHLAELENWFGEIQRRLPYRLYKTLKRALPGRSRKDKT